jgi:hypothetical protein
MPKNFGITGNRIERTFQLNEQANKLGYAMEWNAVADGEDNKDILNQTIYKSNYQDIEKIRRQLAYDKQFWRDSKKISQ